MHEVLAEGEPRAPRHPVRARVAYHDACHLGHAQKVRAAAPRACCARSRASSSLDLPEAELCCGSAGIYNMVAPEAAGELGRAQGREHPRRPGRTSSSPPTRAACCRSASTSASTCRCCTRCSCSTRASAGCRYPARNQRLPDLVTARTLPGMSGMSLAAYQQQPDAIGGSLGLSALVSLLPLAVVLVLLGGFKVRAQWAALAGLATALLVAILGFAMPAGMAVLAAAARGVLRPVPDHVDRGQRPVDLQHDRCHRPLRRAAPQLRRVLGGPAHAGDPHRVLLRRPAGGARGLRRTGRDHVGDARRAGLRADAGGRSWRSWPTPRPSRSGRWRCRSSRWRR